MNKRITEIDSKILTMLTLGHIAASYLIAEGVKSAGFHLTNTQILETIIAGNIIDLDFLYSLNTGKSGEKHHQFITHTPIATIIISLLLIYLFKANTIYSLVLLFVMLAHLVLDDLGHWIYKLGIHKYPVPSQINWLYPLTEFSKRKVIENNREVLKVYLTKAWPTFILEVLLTVSAIYIYLLNF